MTENQCYQRLCLHDLSFDIQKTILSNQNPFMIRTLNRRMQDCIDNFPEHKIRLSREGSRSSSTDFFSSLHGKLSITSIHGLNFWFRSYLGTLCQSNEKSLIDHGLQLELDDTSLLILSENLARALEPACSTKIRNMSLGLRDSCNVIQKTFSLLSGLDKYIESVELRLEITPRFPITLLDVAERLAELPCSISFAELAVRSITSNTA
jgi:hypothetical protein